jgi:hypothetical protein
MKKLDDMTAAEVSELCTVARDACRKTLPWERSGHARFVWRGRTYEANVAHARMLVDTVAGEPVACRWH